jgi:citrate synthase
MAKPSLTVTDNRTGKTYELPIENGTIRANDLRQIKEGPDDFGMMTYDPAFMNTAACKSRVTFIDGDAGILRYRGYPIEQRSSRSSRTPSPTTRWCTRIFASSSTAFATTRTRWACW